MRQDAIERVQAGRADRSGIRGLSLASPGTLLLAMPLCLLAVTIGLSLPTNHDEHQYVAAAHLFSSARIYAEFFHSQTPYFPVTLSLWLGALEPLVPSAYVAARLFNIAWSLVFILALVGMLVRLSPSRLLAAAIGLALVCSEVANLPMRVARNDMMPLALATLALAVIVQACLLDPARHRRRAALHLLSGLLIAAAVGTKQSYGFIALTVMVYAVAAPHLGWRDRWRTQVLPLVIGGAAGAVPMLLLAAQTSDNFLYAVVEFHRTHHLWWAAQTPEQEAILTSFAVRAYVLFRTFAMPAFVTLALGFVAFLAVAIPAARNARRPVGQPLLSILLLSVLTVAAALPVFLLPVPLHAQYVAPVLPFIGVAAAAAAALLGAVAPDSLAGDARLWMRSIGALVLAATLIQGFVMPQTGPLAHLRAMLADEVAGGGGRWAAAHAGQVEARLREVLGPPQRSLRIATMMSIYPIGAGFGIFRELASAPFFYQTNDRLPPERVQALAGTSPSLLPALLEREGAEAVLVGYMPSLDAPLLAHAGGRGFLCFKVDIRGGQVDTGGPGVAQLWVAPRLARVAPDC